MKPVTPLPWKYGEDKMGRKRIFGQEGIECARALWKAIKTKDERDQNAAYIVEACNAYPQLVFDRERLIRELKELADNALTHNSRGVHADSLIGRNVRALLAELEARK